MREVLSFLILFFIAIPSDLHARSERRTSTREAAPSLVVGAFSDTKSQTLEEIKNKIPFYLNIEGSTEAPLLNQAFQNPDSCKLPNCEAVARINNQVALAPTGAFKAQEKNGTKLIEMWIEVEFLDKDNIYKKAWIKRRDLVKDKPSLMGNLIADLKTNPQATWQQNNFGSKFMKACKTSLWNPEFMPGIYDILGASKKWYDKNTAPSHLSTKEITEKIKDLAGVCSYEKLDSPQISDFLPDNSNKGSQLLGYDSIVLPALIQKSAHREKGDATALSQITGLNIPNLTPQKFFEIDALARTIFAEMGSCHKKGREYFQAVARVIKNREAAVIANDENSKTFIFSQSGTVHSPIKTVPTKIATSPVQFTSWNLYRLNLKELAAIKNREIKRLTDQKVPEIDAKAQVEEMIKAERKSIGKAGTDPNKFKFYIPNTSGLQHTLCPPARTNEKSYENRLPSEAELKIWRDALLTAVEATMEPDKFNRTTADLKGILYYTSGMSEFAGMKAVKASIHGKPLSESTCLNLWRK